MAEDMVKKAATIDDLKVVIEDIYSRLNKKADKKDLFSITNKTIASLEKRAFKTEVDDEIKRVESMIANKS